MQIEWIGCKIFIFGRALGAPSGFQRCTVKGWNRAVQSFVVLLNNTEHYCTTLHNTEQSWTKIHWHLQHIWQHSWHRSERPRNFILTQRHRYDRQWFISNNSITKLARPSSFKNFLTAKHIFTVFHWQKYFKLIEINQKSFCLQMSRRPLTVWRLDSETSFSSLFKQNRTTLNNAEQNVCSDSP